MLHNGHRDDRNVSNVLTAKFDQTDADQSEIMAIKAELRGALLSVASKLLKDTDTRLHHLSKAAMTASSEEAGSLDR